MNKTALTSGLVDERGWLTTDILGQYLAGVGGHELLTAAEEVRLAQAMEAGDEAQRELGAGTVDGPAELARLKRAVRKGREARREFIEANLRLVVSNARRYAGGKVDMLDLIQEGNLGLITAVERFDWRKGFKFSTYATWWIRQAMQRARANLGDSVRIPAGVFDVLPAVRTAAEELRAKLGRPATAAEIAERTGVSTRDVEKALSVAVTVALETPIGEDGAQLGDFIADRDAIDTESEVERRIVGERLREVVARLPDLERRALELRFGLDDRPPAAMSRVSEVTGLPVHQVSILISETLETLRQDLEAIEEMRAA